jgi:P4 family phage/plasmid primase-like protien
MHNIKSLIQLLIDAFLNREDVLAVQQGRVPMPLDLEATGLFVEEALEAHIRGEIRLGTYTPRPSDSRTQWLCLDFDGGSHDVSVALDDATKTAMQSAEACTRRGIPFVLERSGSGEGWHLWVFFDRFVPAAQARTLAREVLSDIFQGEKVEIYPKQDRISPEGYGNLIWLPLWGGANPGCCVLLDASGMPVVTSGGIVRHPMPEAVPQREPSSRGVEKSRLVALAGESFIKSTEDRAGGSTLAGRIATAQVDLPAPPLDELPRILRHIPNSGSHALHYDDWFRVLAACYNGWGEDAEAFAREWSMQAEKHEDRMFDGRWRSLVAKPRRDGAGPGTLIYLARQTGYELPSSRERYDESKAAPEGIERGSHVEIARHLLEKLGGISSVVFDRGTFYLFDEACGFWRGYEEEGIHKLIMDYDGLQILQGFKADGSPKVKTLDLSSSDVQGIYRVLRNLAAQGGYFDGSVAGVTFRNGFLGVDGLEPTGREQRSRHFVDADFDADMPRPLWEGYLKYLEPSKAAYLQEKIGACVFGDATSFGKATILLGEAYAGKSTFLDVVRELFPEEQRVAIAPQEWGQEYRRARFARAKINLVGEMPEADIMGSEAVKSIITGDVINGRFIREGDFDFRPRCGHIIAGNSLPHSTDLTTGFWRRWMVVEFDMAIPSDARIRDYDQLVVERELVGVYAWAWEGYRRLAQQGGYTVPADHERVMREWELRADQVKMYLATRTSALGVVDGAGVSVEDLYRDYVVWALREGRGKLSLEHFRLRVERVLGEGQQVGENRYRVMVKK